MDNVGISVMVQAVTKPMDSCAPSQRHGIAPIPPLSRATGRLEV
jgi:hypothetical protein